MVYGIVKNHNGHISCYSEPGQGAIFKIYLPVTAKEALEKDEKEEKPKGGGETILLVDDEDFILDIGREIFTKFGYTVMTAVDGPTALECYRKAMEEIDIVILDLNMPVMGGKRCLEELLLLNPQAKVIVSSGYIPSESTKEVLDLGARCFLSKPYQVNQALKMIREVLDND
jgi:CheY-like chemotaxis protein